MKTRSIQIALLITSLVSAMPAHGSFARTVGWATGKATEVVVTNGISVVGQLLPWGRSSGSTLSVLEAANAYRSASSFPFYSSLFTTNAHQPKPAEPKPQENTQSNKQNHNVADILASGLDGTKDMKGPVSITINLTNEHTQHTGNVLPDTQKDAAKSQIGQSSQDWYTSTTHWIGTHKLRCAWYSLLLTYGTIQTSLIATRWSLMQDTAWSLWKRHCTLEDLYRIKQADLIKDLLRTLEDPESENKISALPLNRCIQEIDKEIDSLKRYRLLVGLVDRRFFKKIFFYNERLLEESLDRIQRLRFIRSTACAALNDLKQHHSYEALFPHQNA